MIDVNAPELNSPKTYGNKGKVMNQQNDISSSNDLLSLPVADLLDAEVGPYETSHGEKCFYLTLFLEKSHGVEFVKKIPLHLLVGHEDMKQIVAKLQKYLDDFS